mgnify:CR=1 FL=1
MSLFVLLCLGIFLFVGGIVTPLPGLQRLEGLVVQQESLHRQRVFVESPDQHSEDNAGLSRIAVQKGIRLSRCKLLKRLLLTRAWP